MLLIVWLSSEQKITNESETVTTVEKKKKSRVKENMSQLKSFKIKCSSICFS